MNYLKSNNCLFFVEAEKLQLYADVFSELMETTQELAYSGRSSDMSSEVLGNGSDKTELKGQNSLTFLVESETLEDAYCFGLDMLEHLAEQLDNTNVSFFLFLKNPKSAEGYQGFTFKEGAISAEFTYEVLPHDTSIAMISGNDEFKSRMYACLREIPNKNPEMMIL